MADLGTPMPLRLSLLRTGREPGIVGILLSGRVSPADVGRIDRRIEGLLDEWLPRVLVCDVAGVTAPDLSAVDALARVRLTAGRRGCDVRLQGVSCELHRLLELAGLRGVLVGADSGGGALGQAEEREEGRGVEEGVDPGDPAS